MSPMHVTQISLEALLTRAVNCTNGTVDPAALEAFCAVINKEKDGPQIAIKVLAARLPFGGEQEVLGILCMLDMCMPKCGICFQNEVGKFRFLNEMIKLVSPKYLGGKTPLTVKLRVLELLYLWTVDYPNEVKIKEAFDMLRKQGVIKDLPNPNIPQEALTDRKRVGSSVFQDKEKSNILRKLLQSKDPEDIQAANWLIKSMVKEEEKISDLKSKAVSELESVQNNLKLLNEMMGSYRKGVTTQNELDIMKELYDNCVRLRPNLTSIACQSNQCPEDLLENVLRTSDEVTEALSKYHRTILLDKQRDFSKTNLSSLLEFDHDVYSQEDKNTNSICSDKSTIQDESSVDILGDLLLSEGDGPENTNILKPVSYSSENSNGNNKDTKSINGLEDLDFLSEHLLKENLPSCNQRNDKLPMNLLCQINEHKQTQQVAASREEESLKFDLNYLFEKSNRISEICHSNEEATSSAIDNSDDCLVDITEDNDHEQCCSLKQTNGTNEVTKKTNNLVRETKSETKRSSCDTNKLNDIFIKLEDIKPSSKKSVVALDEKNGISVLLHLAKDRPKPGVSVFVVTTISKNDLALSGYDFKAVVSKGCKLRLQPPSSTELPPFNPFLPPAAITQIMLVASPAGAKVNLKFSLSYVMDDESMTEMDEVEDLPLYEGDWVKKV